MKKTMSKIENEKEEMYVVECLLNNYSVAIIKIPEDNWDEADEDLKHQIKTEGLFNAEYYIGSIKISGIKIDYLNCKKVIALIY